VRTGAQALITRTRTSTDILFYNKTRVSIFYFDSNTAIPIVPLYILHILTGCLFV